MHQFLLALFLLSLLSPCSVHGQGVRVDRVRKHKRGGKKTVKAQVIAVDAWGASLTEDDYNVEQWPNNPSNTFHKYTNLLSKVFSANNAVVNFVLVGACDGTHDKTIAERFLPNLHWRAAFVEAISFNVRDLKEMLMNNSALDRSYVFHAAATDVCLNSTIMVQRPRLEEKSQSIQHWMRRQIGGIASKNHLLPEAAQADRKSWALEEVRCVTGNTILTEWATSLYSKKMAEKNRFRPHVLKVDAEGHDYEVLMSFIQPLNKLQLPLLIDFEAKSLQDNYSKTVALLESK
jgi:hypothetical protein